VVSSLLPCPLLTLLLLLQGTSLHTYPFPTLPTQRLPFGMDRGPGWACQGQSGAAVSETVTAVFDIFAMRVAAAAYALWASRGMAALTCRCVPRGAGALRTAGGGRTPGARSRRSRGRRRRFSAHCAAIVWVSFVRTICSTWEVLFLLPLSVYKNRIAACGGFPCTCCLPT